MVFGFGLGGENIGTIRIVPMGYRLTLTESLLTQLDPAAPVPADGDWEVGRLVLAPEYRTDVDALRHCLFLALSYASSHATVRCLHASCTHVLARLYRRFGFQAVARDVPLAGSGKTYTLIQGETPPVLKALSGSRASTAGDGP